MKKVLLSLAAVLALGGAANAQTGIGTVNPDASAVLDLSSTTQGLLLPRMTQAQRNNISNPANGLAVYCTNCVPAGIYVNIGTAALPNWQISGTANGGAANLNCGTATVNGTYAQNLATTSTNTITVPVTVVTAGTYTATSNTVNGVTFTGSGTFASTGASTITLYASGTPTAAGTATYTIALGASSCNLNVNYAATSVAALTCGSGTTTGTVYVGSAASGVSFSVPYTGGNGGAYAAQSINSTGVTGLTASLAAGNLANGSGSLTYTVSGTPSATGTASFALSLGGQSCTYTVTAISRTSNGTAVVSGINCNYSSSGTLQQGVVPTNTINQVISATSANTGTFNFSTNTVNGITFSSDPTNYFISSGVGTIYLYASGTPLQAGTFTYTLNTVPGCSFTRTVSQPATFTCGSGIVQTLSPAGSLVNNTAYTGTVSIPYTSGNNSSYGATTLGPVNGLTLTRVPGTFSPSGGNVVYNLSGTYTGTSYVTLTFTGFDECPSANVIFGDAIRGALVQAGCASCAAYDAAATDAYVNITQAEYDALSSNVSGITNFGMKLADRGAVAGSSSFVSNMMPNNIPTTAIPFAFSTKMLNSSAGCVKLIKQANSVNATMEVDWSSAAGIQLSAPGGSGTTTYYFVIKRPTIYMPANTNIAVHGYYNGYGNFNSGGNGCDGCTASGVTSTGSAIANETNCTLTSGTVTAIPTAGTFPSAGYINYDIKWTTTKQW